MFRGPQGSPQASLVMDEARLRSALEHLLEGAQVIDREWRYLYINPAAAAHGGRTVGELLGRSMLEAYPGIENTHVFEVLQEAMESRLPAHLENAFVRPDGTERWFELVIQPVPEGLFVLSLDITDRKDAEAELRESRERFAAVVENLREGLIIVDRDGNLLHSNRAALTMLGFTSSERVHANIHDLTKQYETFTLEGQPVPPPQRPVARALRGEEFSDLELRVRHVGERTSDRILSYSGASVPVGNDVLAFVTIRDVTERKDLERQFMRAQRLESIGTLAGGIAHDLNNILMPITMGSTLLRRSNPPQKMMRTIDNIERSAKRGSELVRQILSFARGADAWSANIDFRDVAAELRTIVYSTFPRTIELSIDVAEDLHPISGEATQLFQVLLNLAVNARDAMPNGGRIRVMAANTVLNAQEAQLHQLRPGAYVVIEIADDGTGMSPDVVRQIFDPFFTTKPPGKGTGLGLFTVHEIVRHHAGHITVVSEPGKGTRFAIRLPASAHPSAEAAFERDLADVPRGDGELVMIVDDEATILAVARQTLEDFGYEVVTVDDGAQAIALYASMRSEIAAVVTDMMMGVVDGGAVIASLLRMTPGLPIIATSGDSTDDWASRARAAGATRTLPKPYTVPVLLRTLADVIASR